MPAIALDVFLSSMRAALRAVEASVRAEAERRERDDASAVLNLAIPTSPAEDAPVEMLSLPLTLFRDRRRQNLAALSIVFDGRLRDRRRGRIAPGMHIQVGRTWRDRLLRRRFHRVSLSFRASDDWQARVDIDGRPVIVPSRQPSCAG